MQKTILITGATDGIGKATAMALMNQGHLILLHGRSAEKLQALENEINTANTEARIETYVADLSELPVVRQFAAAVNAKHSRLDVLINNAGVYKVANRNAANGMDIRFVVNTFAPYLLTKALLPTLASDGRVINLSSAAQAPVEIDALTQANRLSDDAAYAQSKLALTMWSRALADTLGSQGPAIIAVNPASFLGSKMVKEAYGVSGKDLNIGADVLVRAALSDEFANASGLYYDNDRGTFSKPHADALDDAKVKALTDRLDTIVSASG